MSLEELLIWFPEVAQFDHWIRLEPLVKGYSNDKKYCLYNVQGERFLVRVCEDEMLKNKVLNFEMMQLFWKERIPVSQPLLLGGDNAGRCYQLFSWLDGDDAELVVPTLSDAQQYTLGKQAGKWLHQMHAVKTNHKPRMGWKERYEGKIVKALFQYRACGIQLPHESAFIRCIEDNKHLLGARGQVWQHGDYHIGNMVMSDQDSIGIIDFGGAGWGDPWEEFKSMIWCLHGQIPSFAQGQIAGYFGDEIPETFWRLLALYFARNAVMSVPWSIPFGDKEIEKALQNARIILDLYENFLTYQPKLFLRYFDVASMHS